MPKSIKPLDAVIINLKLNREQKRWLSRAWRMRTDEGGFTAVLNYRTPPEIEAEIKTIAIRFCEKYKNHDEIGQIYVGKEGKLSQRDADTSGSFVEFVLRQDWKGGLFITITSSIERSADQWRKLINWLMDFHFKGSHYVWSLEPHKSGILHAHLMMGAPASTEIWIPEPDMEMARRREQPYTKAQLAYIERQRWIQADNRRKEQTPTLLNACHAFSAAVKADDSTLQCYAKPIISNTGTAGYVCKYVIKNWNADRCDWGFDGFNVLMSNRG